MRVVMGEDSHLPERALREDEVDGENLQIPAQSEAPEPPRARKGGCDSTAEGGALSNPTPPSIHPSIHPSRVWPSTPPPPPLPPSTRSHHSPAAHCCTTDAIHAATLTAAPAPEPFLLQPSFCSTQHSMQPPSSRLPGHPCPKHPVLCCTWPTHPHGGAACPSVQPACRTDMLLFSRQTPPVSAFFRCN
ncbi:uncharacterized protein IWZ02DRAFT_135590 [Phyllosticta citriasiana]|uniref:uncharacterized protein n=1 Tax=Phyllosticta citriasiana TaxID=595635 RepID=UPI0030FDD6F2